ncbi:actin cytoskeleton organization protein App1 [Coccidioides immitis RS]|uniref:Actin cytoskeleton organization protein App1 n=3 Tax=Coccidioides immitis TaxID=5501 RepID=A0A0E1S0I1_COCIM|nr:actin cytoskeleton organization protein App1 [Coccidioides immitis RS]EAS28446.2 actin cytoskeleton organization protein App1 [Coccidioides immitis RS]KMP02757.1 Hypothetical Protein CIRG_02449 [Coccidioides immitis RMSCC 2394]KMU92404.1 App1p [Coccidioides immitis H538.4]
MGLSPYTTEGMGEHRVHSRIYRAIIERQNRRRLRPKEPTVKTSHQRGLGRPASWSLHVADGGKGRVKDAVIPNTGGPNTFAEMEARGESWSLESVDEGRERGSRRRKVFGYLRAANELRQAYSAQWSQRSQGAQGSSRDVQDDFSGFEMARSADEEMVLFPSYGKRHVKSETRNGNENDHDGLDSFDDDNTDRAQSQGIEYWESIWHRYEADNAIVDVDVRGWIFSPQKEPMSRKNRLLITLARKISGIPAPNQTLATDGHTFSQADSSLENQAESIVRKQTDSSDNGQPLGLTQDEIAAANAQLMDRLRPFLTNPAVGIPATIFFFNDIKSESRTVLTNEGGHFAARASLDFVPSHIRVLASENLSATEEVKIIEQNGVSIISDIDDTVKHSAIISGAKEMFRNTFVRDLVDLSVPGVKEWYSQMARMGVDIHYVSNSPWQLYPLLKNYFSLVGLPPGSIHLKQYSGMLQGIFEPTADRKRPTLERIIQDFPSRQFILVGDSGEADLEIYTDLVLANPGRILGIFIRDVTTPGPNNFFDKSISHLEKPLPRRTTWDETLDSEKRRPPLPPRKPQQVQASSDEAMIGNLIELESDEDTYPLDIMSRKPSNTKSAPPTPPAKPSKLRGESVETTGSQEPEFLTVIRRKPVPPPPVKPSALSVGKGFSEPNSRTSSSSNVSTSNLPRAKDLPPVPPPRRSGTSSSIKQQSEPPKPLPGNSGTQHFVPPMSLSDRPFNPPYASSPSPIHPTSRTSTPQSLSSSDIPTPNKREEAWRRRWARAREILDRRGVMLQSWRVGDDVQDVCVRLVKQAQPNMNKEDVMTR